MKKYYFVLRNKIRDSFVNRPQCAYQTPGALQLNLSSEIDERLSDYFVLRKRLMRHVKQIEIFEGKITGFVDHEVISEQLTFALGWRCASILRGFVACGISPQGVIIEVWLSYRNFVAV